MQIEARFRRRAEAGESLSELNDFLLGRLSKVTGLWSDGRSIEDCRFDAGSGESAGADLSPCLANGIKGAISYASRLPAAIVDKAISDDYLVIRFDADIVNFQLFSRHLFSEIIKIFRPYRANIVTDLDQDLDDFEDIVKEAQRTGRDVDGRDTVFRLHSVNYFDSIMCLRAFGMDPEHLVGRLKGEIVLADLLQDGVLLILSEDPVLGEPLLTLDALAREKLD